MRALLPGCCLPSGWAARTRLELGGVRPCGSRGGGARGVRRCAGGRGASAHLAGPGKGGAGAAPGAFPAETQAQRACRGGTGGRKGCGRSSGCRVTRGGQRLEPTPSAVRRPNPSPVRVLGLPVPGGVTAGLKSRQGLRFFRSDRERTPRSRRQARGSEAMQWVAGALQRWTK